MIGIGIGISPGWNGGGGQNPAAMVIGDTTAGYSIAAGASRYPGYLDNSYTDFADATLSVTASGSGSVTVGVRGVLTPGQTAVTLTESPIITALSAGEATYDMSALPYFPFYQFIFTEAGGSSAVEVTATLMQSGTWTQPYYFPTIGDWSAAYSITAGATAQPTAVDMQGIDLSRATLVVIVTGSGTLSVSVGGSSTLTGSETAFAGNPIMSGLTAGTHYLDLDGSPTHNFWHMDYTETGGVSSASVQSYIVTRAA